MVGRAEGQQRAHARCGCCAPATRIRSTRVARSGSTPCTAGSTTSSTASRTASRPRSRSRSRTRPTSGRTTTPGPSTGTQNVDLFLRATGDPAAAGTLGGKTGGARRHARLHRAHEHEREHAHEHADGRAGNRRVFISQPLKKDVRLSGTAWPTWRPRSGANAGELQRHRRRLRRPERRRHAPELPAGVAQRRGPARTSTTQRTCWGDGGNNALTGEAGPACASLGAVVHRDRA